MQKTIKNPGKTMGEQIIKENNLVGLLYSGDKINSLLILGHSAGSDMHDSDFKVLATKLASEGIAVFSIQFPYRIAERRIAERVQKSTISFMQAIKYSAQFHVPIFIGGRSYGGRVASHFLEENPTSKVSGCICLAFPLKTPKSLDNSRGSHLKSLKRPLLMIQGNRDPMGHPTELLKLVNIENKNTKVISLAYADHSFKPLKKHPATHNDILAQTSIIVCDWIKSIVKN